MDEREVRACTPGAQGTARAIRCAWLALVIWACPPAAEAYRPFDSTDAGVTSHGAVELELGPVGYLVEGPTRALIAPSVVLSWGFADRWEVALEGRHFLEVGKDTGGPRLHLEDTAVSLKRVLREGSLEGMPGPSLATEVGALLPATHGEQGMGATWVLILSQQWPDLTVHVNGAASWTRAHRPAAFGGLILEGHDSWPVRPVGELLVEHERDAPTTFSGLVGAIWRVSDALSFDVAARFARAGELHTTELRAGLTWSFDVGSP